VRLDQIEQEYYALSDEGGLEIWAYQHVPTLLAVARAANKVCLSCIDPYGSCVHEVADALAALEEKP
jgi:hypothetical protein